MRYGTRQRREHVSLFVKTYEESIGHDPSDTEITCHLDCERQHDVMTWVNPSDHHRADILARKGLLLIESSNASRYHWVAVEIVRTRFVLNNVKAITQADITVDDSSNYMIMLVMSDERVCSSFEGCSVPLYKCLTP